MTALEIIIVMMAIGCCAFMIISAHHRIGRLEKTVRDYADIVKRVINLVEKDGKEQQDRLDDIINMVQSFIDEEGYK